MITDYGDGHALYITSRGVQWPLTLVECARPYCHRQSWEARPPYELNRQSFQATMAHPVGHDPEPGAVRFIRHVGGEAPHRPGEHADFPEGWIAASIEQCIEDFERRLAAQWAEVRHETDDGAFRLTQVDRPTPRR